MAARMSDLLDNPINVALRQAAVLSYGASIENAKYCFDTAHVLTQCRVLSPGDLLILNTIRMSKLAESRNSAASKGEMPAADVAGHVGGVPKSAQPVSGGNIPPQERRTQFAKV